MVRDALVEGIGEYANKPSHANIIRPLYVSLQKDEPNIWARGLDELVCAMYSIKYICTYPHG